MCVFIGSSHAQAPVPVVPFEGSEIFCHILRHFKFAPIASIEALPNYAAEETLIVVFGDLTPLEEIAKHAANANLEGYAVLLASDRRSGNYVRTDVNSGWRWVETKLKPWRLKIEGSEVQVAEEQAYKSRPFNPFLKREHTSSNHPIFRGLSTGLATNRPSYVASEDSDLLLLAGFPSSAVADRQLLRNASAMTGYIFGSTADADSRTLVLAGHGVFMNGMLAQEDNDNGLFTINTVRWLRGPENARKYALMIHDGRVVDSFDLPLTELPNMPLPPVQVINQMLRELENEGIVNRFLEEVIGWPWVLRIAIMVGTLGLFMYGFYRLFPMRYRFETTPLIVGAPVASPTTLSLLRERQWELLMQDNLWEPAQTLARQWFLDHAGVHAPLWDGADPSPPSFDIKGGWIARRRLVQQIHGLWGFAIRDPSQAVSRQEFDRLTAILTALNDAVRSGRLIGSGA
jgi:hypothetical protein